MGFNLTTSTVSRHRESRYHQQLRHRYVTKPVLFWKDLLWCLAKLVPVEGSISLEDLQKVTSLDPVNLVRVLRHAMTNHVFREPIPGHFAHTAASLEFSEDVSLQAWTGFVAEDILPAGAHTIEALRSYPEATSQLHTGFNVAFDTIAKESMFATLGRDSSRAKRMGDAMKSLTQGHGFEVSYFVDNYDMSDIANGTFVDIGGSYGFSCVALAKRWPKMKFVVQDTRQTVESAPQPFSDDDTVAQRITLQAHDFFTEQPVKGADGELHSRITIYKLRADMKQCTTSAGSCTTGRHPMPCEFFAHSYPP